MSDSTTIVLSEIDKYEGSNSRGPYTRFTLKDGNGQSVAATFSVALGAAADALKGERVLVETKPARDPKYAPELVSIKPAPAEKQQTGDVDKMSKQEWAAKDHAAHKRACIAIAAGALTHTMKSEPSRDDISNFASNTLALAKFFFTDVMKEHLLALGQGADATFPNDDDIPF